MNVLLQKYNDYLRLKDCRAEYEFSNGTKIIVPYREINFPHLLGLHKLKDIQLIQFWLDKSNKTVINSKIKSDYILFEERPKNEYNHMGIAQDAKSGTRYVETFFHQPTDMYITGQNIVKVKKFVLYDSNNKIREFDKGESR